MCNIEFFCSRYFLVFDIIFPGEYSANVFTDAAVEKIKNRGEDPFFMYLSYMNVHSPYQVVVKLLC